MYQRIFILLGTNKGDRLHYLSSAKELIEISVGEIIQQSSIYETAAWGKADQQDFLNQVIGIKSIHKPEPLLGILLKIENELGRQRIEKWGPREIDLDILFYSTEIIDTETLSIPHPAIAERRFTLVPLAEIAPSFIHPTLKKNMLQLLEECTDVLEVKKVL
jgi:2-amino-4-hydroxy-6-hydroxymethyldihydropteridine diphosphokinase